jgi:hypothetical protein
VPVVPDSPRVGFQPAPCSVRHKIVPDGVKSITRLPKQTVENRNLNPNEGDVNDDSQTFNGTAQQSRAEPTQSGPQGGPGPEAPYAQGDEPQDHGASRHEASHGPQDDDSSYHEAGYDPQEHDPSLRTETGRPQGRPGPSHQSQIDHAQGHAGPSHEAFGGPQGHAGPSHEAFGGPQGIAGSPHQAFYGP